MEWHLQRLGINDDERLVKAVESQGHKAHLHDLRTLMTKDWSSCKGVIHTSCNMHTYLSRHIRTLTPEKELRCQHYYAYWGEYLANDDYQFAPLGEIYRAYAFDEFEPFFIRPDTNNKIFTGHVIECLRDLGDLLYDLPKETLCVTSSAKEFLAEWRLIIHRGKVISGSLYRQNGMHDEVENSTYKHLDPQKFAEKIASQPFPGLPSIYVMDIALLNEEENIYGLLEIGGINCCGFYSCDLEPVVKAVTLETELLYKEEEDA